MVHRIDRERTTWVLQFPECLRKNLTPPCPFYFTFFKACAIGVKNLSPVCSVGYLRPVVPWGLFWSLQSSCRLILTMHLDLDSARLRLRLRPVVGTTARFHQLLLEPFWRRRLPTNAAPGQRSYVTRLPMPDPSAVVAPSPSPPSPSPSSPEAACATLTATLQTNSFPPRTW